MASITEHVIKLQELTQRNLEILQAINDSFFTKQDHLSVNIGGQQYAMPSFLSLENKLNSLTANFENLVNAPQSGEAFFNFDGSTRAIEVRSYTSTPNSLSLGTITGFNVENNDIFKDFVTPKPYVKISVKDLPNDIVNVMVKKIIPINPELKAIFEEKLGNNIPSTQYSYRDLYKQLSIYKEDIDYIEYDTKTPLPIRKNIGSGIYVVEEIMEDYVDENLDNYLVLKFRSNFKDEREYMNSLKYRLFDETIEKYLKVGDQLVTYNGGAKLEIQEVKINTNTVKVKVLHGEFLNLAPSNPNDVKISQLSKIKFFSPIDFNEDKYIKIPLEEDKYLFIAVAALNDRMNVQSPWGNGLMLNTSILSNELREEEKFETYYKNNVKNVGDTLFEIISMVSNTIMDKSEQDYLNLTNFVPEINPENLIVTQINNHLNNSIAVQNIRSLYSQKKNFQSQLNEVQEEIATINNTLSSISFDDTSGMREAYTSQLTTLTTKRNEISTSITKIINDISVAANNSEVPIENAKYRIRGFYDCKGKKYIRGIEVQYRYKNVDQTQNQALTISDQFTFSDWNVMDGFNRNMISKYEDDKYKFEIEADNSKSNEPSFNQIDIPISQGEIVDIKLKVLYSYGWPFVSLESQWSPIITIQFPEEYLKDVKILDIIEENNNDIETNRFTNIINESGIPTHINDKITDQDITYWHKPENIASGFYTNERRIIPLKDKLFDLDSALLELKDEVFGTSTDSLKVYIKHDNNSIQLLPYQTQDIYVAGYKDLVPDTAQESTDQEAQDIYNHNGVYEIDSDTKFVSTVLNICIINESNHTVKLFSMFPGDKTEIINRFTNKKFTLSDYADTTDDYGVWIVSYNDNNLIKNLQRGNQFLYFRLKNINTGEEYYNVGNTSSINKLSKSESYISFQDIENLSINKSHAFMYPKLSNEFELVLESKSTDNYMILAPGQEIIVPVVFEYKIKDNEISKTISFDILPSLYKDPIPFSFRVNAKGISTLQDNITATGQQVQRNWWGNNDTKYNITYK